MPTSRRRPHAPRRTARLGLLAPLGFLAVAGCHHDATTVSDAQKAQSPIKCEAVASTQVVVSPPVVAIQDGVMSISGTVHRQPGVTGPLDGRIDIDLIGRDGLKLDNSLHAPMIPNTVPLDPSQSSAYAPTPFGYVPPDGSTVRARYVTRQEAIMENLRDGILDVNGNGGHTGDGVPPSQENGSMPTNGTGGGH